MDNQQQHLIEPDLKPATKAVTLCFFKLRLHPIKRRVIRQSDDGWCNQARR
jgi:hypothetical protein